MIPRRSGFGAVLIVTASGLLADCGKDNSFKPPPPPEVGVARPVTRSVTPYLETTGNIAAYNSVDLLARVEGFVSAIDYQDGAEVKAGARLFVIEPEPYQAKYQQAEASVAAAQAQFAQSDAEYKRQSSLGSRDFASQAAVEQARAQRNSNQANLQSQQAGLTLAGINLSYANVTAPFDGVVTAHLVTVGALVGVSGPTKLASVVQLDPVYVNFAISEQDVQRIRVGLAQAGLTVAQLGTIEAEIKLATEQQYLHRGVLDYVAPNVDAGTGTLSVRAVIQNPSRVLLPGYFASVRVPLARKAATALLVPDAAIGTAQTSRYVLVVDKGNVVQQRNVRIGQIDGPLRVIESGLEPEDQVVVSGLARAIPGEKVSSTPTPIPQG